MAITINGDGTITGVSVGGLPDGIVDTDMLAADAVTADKVGHKGFVSYAIICDEKTSDTDGGTFTSGDWRTRDLNTEIADPDGIVSIASNQFTLGAGNYLIEASAPAYRTNRHILRLQNITSSTTVQIGSAEYTNDSDAIVTRSVLAARVSLTGSTTLEIQHRAETTSSTFGFGVDSSFTGVGSIYTIVKIFKEA